MNTNDATSCGMPYDCHSDNSRGVIYDRNIFIIQTTGWNEVKKFSVTLTPGRLETFFLHHRWRGLISSRVCPWKPFPVRSSNLRARPEPTKLEHLSDASFLGKLLVLPAKVRLDWKVIARYKQSSLFGLVVSNEGKMFYNFDPQVYWKLPVRCWWQRPARRLHFHLFHSHR